MPFPPKEQESNFRKFQGRRGALPQQQRQRSTGNNKREAIRRRLQRRRGE